MSQSTNTRVALFPGPAQLLSLLAFLCWKRWKAGLGWGTGFIVKRIVPAGLGWGTGFIVKRIVPGKMQPITSLYINLLPWRLLGRENTEEGGGLGEKLCTNHTSLLNIQCFHTAKSTSPPPPAPAPVEATFDFQKWLMADLPQQFKRGETEECLETAHTLTPSHSCSTIPRKLC